ncbi:MAG: zinc ribbon domain-containing protein, partial [Chloroflexota bacterium]
LMAAAEAAEQATALCGQTVEAEVARWRRDSAEAHQQIDVLEADLEALRAERTAFASTITAENVGLYEQLKPRKANRPVAMVEGALCRACGVSLPSNEVQRARTANPPLQCDNCGRLLWVK